MSHLQAESSSANAVEWFVGRAVWGVQMPAGYFHLCLKKENIQS